MIAHTLIAPFLLCLGTAYSVRYQIRAKTPQRLVRHIGAARNLDFIHKSHTYMKYREETSIAMTNCKYNCIKVKIIL